VLVLVLVVVLENSGYLTVTQAEHGIALPDSIERIGDWSAVEVSRALCS
jgi:hypothetical protein